MAVNQSQIERAVAIANRYGATRLILFGSASENPARARDIDLACDGALGWKLYELGAQLEKELRAPVDVVPLSPSNRFTRLIESQGKVLL